MRTLVATALLAYANADETSLMQDLVTRSSSNKLEAKSSRHDTAAKLLDTAVNMIKSGVTPDVLEFVDATTQETEEVLNIIKADHRREQNFLDGVCQRFTDAVDGLSDDLDQIGTAAVNREGSGEEHQQCRAGEAYACAHSRRCEAQLRSAWEVYVRHESIMRQKHDNIEGGWCVRDPGSNEYGAWHGWQHDVDWLHRPFDGVTEAFPLQFWSETKPYPILDIPQDVRIFRTESVTYFEEYTTQVTETRVAWEAYHAKVEECGKLESDWEAIIPDCDEKQATFHGHACAHATAIKNARTVVGNTWRLIKQDLDNNLERLQNNEQSRKNEWETLTIVQCLLNHVHSSVIDSLETGAPCPTIDSDPDSVNLAIEDCHIVRRGCDDPPLGEAEFDALGSEHRSSTHLCINYCEPPEPPTLPEVEAPPCSPAYVAKEQAQFLDTIQASYGASLASNPSFDLDGIVYGPYTEDQLTQERYGALLSPAGWAGCAPPLVCVDDCPAFTIEDPNPDADLDICQPNTLQALLSGESRCICKLHEEYLTAGHGNMDTFRCLDGTCIEQTGRCNNRQECADGSDEEGCDVFPPVYLSKDFTCPDDFHDDVHYRCANSQCIEKHGLCNGYANCDDESDEAACDAGLQVTVEATSGRSVSVISGGAQTDAAVFSDRRYTFDSLGSMTGKTFIQYSNDDKMIDNVHVMTKIRTVEPVTVFIVLMDQHERLPWLDMEEYELRHDLSGVSFSGVKMTRHKEWALEQALPVHHERLATAHWADAVTTEPEDQFSTYQVWSKTFHAGTISIPGNAGSEHYDGSLSDQYEADASGSFLIFLDKIGSSAQID